MNKRSKYFNLKFMVECAMGEARFFEPIAAFDCEQAASRYAKLCRVNAAIGYRYRVVKRFQSNQWKLVFEKTA